MSAKFFRDYRWACFYVMAVLTTILVLQVLDALDLSP